MKNMSLKSIFIYTCRGDHFLFDLVFIKKNNQIKFKKQTETGSNRPVRFGSVFYDKNLFKPVWLGFSVWLSLGSVRFFQFYAYKIKTKPNQSVFSKILIGFFSQFNFFSYFFSSFFDLISFLVFLLTP